MQIIDSIQKVPGGLILIYHINTENVIFQLKRFARGYCHQVNQEIRVKIRARELRSCNEGEVVDSFCEDVGSAANKAKHPSPKALGYFEAIAVR